jgi:hypothetical protein
MIEYLLNLLIKRAGPKNVQGTRSHVGGDKVGKPLRMIMVHMGKQKRCHNGLVAMLLSSPQEVITQINDARAGINNHRLLPYLKFNTGSIATIPYSLWSWSGIASPSTPEANDKLVGIHADPLKMSLADFTVKRT